MTYIFLLSLVCGAVVVNAGSLPSFITPCSRNQSTDKLSECITNQARQTQRTFGKGVPELNLEPLDPLSLTDLSVKTGSFNLSNTNIIVKGLRRVEIKEMKWDLNNKQGYTKVFGNLTYLSDYEVDGEFMLVPITGSGTMLVKLYNTDMLIKFKIKTLKDAAGIEHLEIYDFEPMQTYGKVLIHLSNVDEPIIGITINRALNDNWQELMSEIGPPYAKAIAEQVHHVINKLFASVPFDELITP